VSENKVLERPLARKRDERTEENHVTRNFIIYTLDIISTGRLNQEEYK
jgi:hypothetical protein